MRRRKKKHFYQLLILLLLCIGIGYAALMTDLSINGVSHVTQSSWSIHFDNIQEDSNSNATVNQAAELTGDTSLSYDITLNQPGDYYEFTVDVVNDGTIDGMIGSVSSKLNNVEITTLPAYLEYSVTYDDDIAIAPNHLLNAGDTETYKIHVGYKKDITEEDLPGDTINLHLVFDVPYEQPDEDAIPRPHLPMLQPTSELDTSTFRSYTYRYNIKIISLSDEINPPANVIESWDIGVAQDGNVMAYITANADDDTKYDLTIQGDGALYANPDSSYWFANLKTVDAINNIDVLNTSKVTNMSFMLYNTGSRSSAFTLDLGDKFDTSNVTNMSFMFCETGLDSTAFTLDLGDKFDTSKVTDMLGMFRSTGRKSNIFTLDLGDKFDTSNVTDMSYMFLYTAEDSTGFTLDLGDNFNTSKVTNMEFMFCLAGYSSTVFTLDLGDKFDTSNVTNMNSIFSRAGYASTVFTLNLGNKFDTSNVTIMQYMFEKLGYSNTIFTLDLGNKFDTSNVRNMQGMFSSTGYSNTNFTLDLSTFDFSSVTTYIIMFDGWSSTQKIYVGNATAQNWIITNSGNSNLTTANVLIKT